MTSSASHLLTAGLTREQRGDLPARLSDEDVRGIVWQLIEARANWSQLLSRMTVAAELSAAKIDTLLGTAHLGLDTLAAGESELG